MSDEFEAQLRGKRLTTAEVIYYMPDHPSLLQRFMWQTLDLAPDYPRVHQFLEFWRREIDAVIHSVNVTAVGEVRAPRVRIAGVISRLH
ncbi:MAG TPA: protein usg [Caulobacteraceae bacterium]|jgi:uncharacterized protein Usg